MSYQDPTAIIHNLIMPTTPSTSIATFKEALVSSNRILSLLGAGLSASSGLATFRGAGGLWRSHDATVLATPEAFAAEPGLVWQFYAHRRHLALKAKPNAAHYALAELARVKEGRFRTLTQNVDGLSPRAGHEGDKVWYLHGNLFDLRCSRKGCDYVDRNNFLDPLCPALEIKESDSFSDAAWAASQPKVEEADLPHCPKCNYFLRPGVVWFGEALPEGILDAADDWVEKGEIDLMLVIGTTAQVWPAAGYIANAKAVGARVAVVNPEGAGRAAAAGLGERDWVFEADAAALLPELFEEVIGKDYNKEERK